MKVIFINFCFNFSGIFYLSNESGKLSSQRLDFEYMCFMRKVYRKDETQKIGIIRKSPSPSPKLQSLCVPKIDIPTFEML